MSKEKKARFVNPATVGPTIPGFQAKPPGGAKKGHGNRPVEGHVADFGEPLSKQVFSPENPDLIWLFTDATEAEIESIGLDPETIDEWGLNIDDGYLPESDEFKTVPEFMKYLKEKIKAVWESKPR